MIEVSTFFSRLSFMVLAYLITSFWSKIRIVAWENPAGFSSYCSGGIHSKDIHNFLKK